MAELAYTDLPANVLARFADNAAAQKEIDTALVAARRYCGWYVSPLRTNDSLNLDGPGGRVLSLPTLNLVSVASVTECGTAVDVSTLDLSKRKGTLTKRFRWCCWTCRDGAITVVATHGFTEAEASDWRAAIIKLVDLRSRASERDTADMTRKKVDDVEYEWLAELVSNDKELGAMFGQFRILPSP